MISRLIAVLVLGLVALVSVTSCGTTTVVIPTSMQSAPLIHPGGK